MFISRSLSRLFTRRVHCANCPNFREIREATDFMTDYMIGACALDAPLMTTFPTVQAAFPVKYSHDWCEKHPLYSPHKGADLSYRPGQRGHAAAGFNRPPTIEEALAMQPLDLKKFALPAQSLDNKNSIDKGDDDAKAQT